MKDKCISYYELLGMIKEGNIPKRIYVKIANYGMYYIADYDGEEFSYYELQDKDVIDENYHFYLSECFLESSMFEKCIQVLDEEEFNNIKEIEIDKNDYLHFEEGSWKARKMDIAFRNKINEIIKNQKLIIERIENEKDNKNN